MKNINLKLKNDSNLILIDINFKSAKNVSYLKDRTFFTKIHFILCREIKYNG